MSVHRNQVLSSTRFLEQKVERFETFHVGNYRLFINDFCDWFVRDDVIGQVALVLHRRLQTSAPAWHEQTQRDGAVPALPEDPAEAMAFRFAVLRLIRREKVDLRFFISNYFPGAHLNEKLMHWKRLIVHPFAEDCRTLSRGMVQAMGSAEWVELAPLLEGYFDGPFQERGFGPRAWTDADDDERTEAELGTSAAAVDAASQPPERVESPLEAALAKLRMAIEEASLTGDDRDDLLLDVQALNLETRRQTFRAPRFRARLDAMAAVVPALSDLTDEVRHLL